jgi:hypothetical protein
MYQGLYSETPSPARLREAQSNEYPQTRKAGHTFASDNDLWRWAYILAIDGVDSAV